MISRSVISLSLGYSPCPNDTFIFYALVHGQVPLEGMTVRERLEDVETLNRMAFREELDISKVSYHAFGCLRDRYGLLRSGAALGKGCGPLLVGRGEEETSKAQRHKVKLADLAQQRIAVPGEFTTASLLLRLYEPKVHNITILPFDQILQAVRKGDVDVGLIIHESRFTYKNFGLCQILDLGDWWERYSGHPIPLGGIMVKRTLGKEVACRIEEAIRQSIRYAQTHPEETKDYIRSHAQEMDDRVTSQHINLYVNEYSLDIGQDGEKAIRFLLAEAEKRGLIPVSSCDLFL